MGNDAVDDAQMQSGKGEDVGGSALSEGFGDVYRDVRPVSDDKSLYDGIGVRVGESRCIYDKACGDAPPSEMIRQVRDAGGEKAG